MSLERPYRLAAPDLSPEEQQALDAALHEHGLDGLTARIEISRGLSFAREVAEMMIRELASETVMVERDVLLGGSWVPYTLFADTGVYAILPSDRSTSEMATVDAILRDLHALDAIVRDLSSLLGGKREYAIKTVFFCPYEEEEPRAWYGTDGHEAWTVGGIEHLKAWLAEQLGPGLSKQDLRLIREASKPRRYEPGRPVLPADDEAPRG
jgi:hypothetical protein